MSGFKDKDFLKNQVLDLKRKKNIAILAHNYQLPEIQEAADYIGDSLELAKISKDLNVPAIAFCGVAFMAQTAKILSPQKKVFLPVIDAGCPLADMISPSELQGLKDKHPDAWVVSYVNTSAEIKALSDVCCTSANAAKVVANVSAKKIIFVPDKNLGWWVKKNVAGKEIILWQGFCYVHERFTLGDLKQAKAKYPEAEVIVHPECVSEVLEEADFVLSTSGMLKRAKESRSRSFIIGTEEGMIYRLKKQNPQKEFYSLGSMRICRNMKKITLSELRRSLAQEVNEISINSEIMSKAYQALERMVEYV